MQEENVKTETTIKLIRDLGFPIFTSVALGFVVWTLGSTMMVQHNRFIDSVSESVKSQTHSMDLVQDAITQQVKLMSTMEKTIVTEHVQTRDVVQSGQHHFVEAAKQMQRLADAIEKERKGTQ